MKRLLSSILFLCFIAPAFAEQSAVPSFTDQDMEKYKRPSERNKSLEDWNAPKDNIDSKGGKKTEGAEKKGLKQFEIPYQAYEGTANRIIIPITFEGSVTAPMLLDTGATGMHISDVLAEKLGIFAGGEGYLIESTGGIGGNVPVIVTVIDKIQVGGLEDHFIPAKIVKPLSDQFDGIIGMDFMTNYTIQIDTRKHVVTFNELPQGLSMPGGHDEGWWRRNFHEFASTRAKWKKFRDTLYEVKDDSKPAITMSRGRRTEIVTIHVLKEYAARQYEAADKLFRKLDGYAIDNAVPMEWREY